MRQLAAFALVASLATPAAADALKVGDLGPVASRRTCMLLAKSVLDAYLDAYGGLSVSGDPEAPDNWSIYAWSLRPGQNDVVILCPIVAGQANAFYTVHASGPTGTEDADRAADRIQELWRRLR